LPSDELADDDLDDSNGSRVSGKMAAEFPEPTTAALWSRRAGSLIEGINAADARAIKSSVGIPVLCTGGFQRGSVIRDAIASGACDGVTMARPLLANYDLPKLLEGGAEEPPRPCTFCNRCLVEVLENPLGCYDVSRYAPPGQAPTQADYDRMMRELMAFYSDDVAAEAPPR
jgi:2,4-dienoyl-CoA reductase (NADPH2)